MSGAPSFINLLRIWIGLIGTVAVGSTIQCFLSPSYTFDRIYTINEGNVTALTTRLFGVWTFLAGALRVTCALDLHNRTLYHLTLLSFILALVHFVSEVFVYKTASVESAGILAPLLVSSKSPVNRLNLLLSGNRYIDSVDAGRVLVCRSRGPASQVWGRK
ncbi:full-length cDNA clone CS0DC006YI13 of Neuroblastoma of Homo sapiens (human) [Elysia marginata]|uniref:Full-length cDNA clone CS0DC006YI13 of Neuroblastoma of Homo sapiens (Human) n=1 Tax=Elysia marginata TaxID=1093978 RepID=A0AAV4EBD3_9GAST|nr:full-length cDNA clone CS0DC006YI13 of Neuroblastoma of Homo sapiens (human) [Elysia marginata]